MTFWACEKNSKLEEERARKRKFIGYHTRAFLLVFTLPWIKLIKKKKSGERNVRARHTSFRRSAKLLLLFFTTYGKRDGVKQEEKRKTFEQLRIDENSLAIDPFARINIELFYFDKFCCFCWEYYFSQQFVGNDAASTDQRIRPRTFFTKPRIKSRGSFLLSKLGRFLLLLSLFFCVLRLSSRESHRFGEKRSCRFVQSLKSPGAKHSIPFQSILLLWSCRFLWRHVILCIKWGV